MACEICRLKKIKCDKIRPKCGRCELRNLSCQYIGERRQPKKLDASEIEKRLHQIENVFRHMNDGLVEATIEAHVNQVSEVREALQPPPVSDAVEGIFQQDSHQTVGNNYMEFSWSIDASPFTSADPVSHPAPIPRATGAVLPTLAISQSAESSKNENLLNLILSGQSGSLPVENNAAVWIRTQDGDEYTGPSSGISLLSNPGLEWIEKTFSETEDICSTLRGVTVDVADHLQMPKCVPSKPWASVHMLKERKSLPNQEVMWKYVSAYFKSVQCIFPALDRHNFESRLHDYLRDPKDPDIAWVALLNTVLASGCRALLSAETPSAFNDSGTEGWGYFQNAIDTVSQLLCKPVNKVVVEAFIVMTVYAQGLSSPQRLEYTFCALATQVAQGLGLHRQPLQSWYLSKSEIQERNRLFWVVYGLDKTISLRCGRPSLIDDDEISCSFPYFTPVLQNKTPNFTTTTDPAVEQSQPNFDFFLVHTQYARICGKIAKQLYSAAALSRPFSQLLKIAASLETDIDKWRDSIPEGYRPDSKFRLSNAPDDFPQIQALSLNFGYHYVICSVHRRFSAMFGRFDSDGPPLGAVRVADTKFLEAARSMILLTKHLDIESHTPGWLLFYYPVTALIGVFIYVVCNPRSESGRNNTALMEVIVGHLGRLEFMTSGGTAFNRIGELVRLARIILDKACNKPTMGSSSNTSREQMLTGTSAILNNRSPNRKRHSTSERLYDARSANEENVDASDLPHSNHSQNHASKRIRTPESPQQPAYQDIVGSNIRRSLDHEHTASSLSVLPSVGVSYESDHQLQTPAMYYPDPSIHLVTGNSTTSFIPHGVDIEKECVTNEEILQWQVQERAIDNYSGWGPGAMNTTDYDQ